MKPEKARRHQCASCLRIFDEEDGSWPVYVDGEARPDLVGDRGPEGFVCYACIAADEDGYTFSTADIAFEMHFPRLTEPGRPWMKITHRPTGTVVQRDIEGTQMETRDRLLIDLMAALKEG